MCSEIDRFSSFLRRMSGNPHHIFADGDERITTSASLDSQTAAEEREKENLEEKGDHGKQPEEIETNNEDESDEATASQREVDDEDDGFKTPTSSDHRIPAIKHCPPAPMKPRPPPPRLKRKATSPPQSYAEIESIFSSIAHDQDELKNKKARTDDDDDDDKDRP